VTTLLRIDSLDVYYGRVQAVRKISLRVDEGTIVTVIGRNGAGKTTLLGASMGFLRCVGDIHFAGQDLANISTDQRVRSGLCLVPEKRELFAGLSVEDNLKLGAFNRIRQGDSEITKDLATIYARFPRLLERRAQLAATLSGGERQMLALGRALMSKPRLLMLDEPSLGLAPRIVSEIFEVITDLRRSGVSVLLVEQNARAALKIADYGYVLETGEITVNGPAADLSTNPRVKESYLGLIVAQSNSDGGQPTNRG
jgi:branched-chain amino acid transport system ATP-binding protein